MDWMKTLLPLLQTGLKMYAGGQLVRQSAEQAKGVAVRSSIVAFGTLGFVAFLVASIIMVFVDLGNQFEAGQGTHFSGMMLAALYLTGLGVVVLGICVVVAKVLASQERARKEAAKPAESPYAPLVVLGEEFLKQLIENLNQQKSGRAPESAGPKG